MNPAFFHDNTALLALLERWAGHGWLRALDAAFAAFLAREEPAAPPLLILAAALASHQLGRGHACLDLAHTLADPGFALSLPPEGAADSAEPVPLPAEVLDGVSLADWQQALRYPPLVGDGAGDGRWVVSIRCGQLSADRLSIDARAGGGIVAESDPDDEVTETTTKFRTMLTALGVPV